MSAAHVVVIATDLRRSTIRVSPNTYLVDVLREACSTLSLDSDKYILRHKQKLVDLSSPFRTSGLLSGAKLELVQKADTPSAALIALQLPHSQAQQVPGGRLIRKLPSDLALWKLLRQFESGAIADGMNLNITARSVQCTSNGRCGLFYEMPVLNIIGRKLSTWADFQKTLSQLGHNSGSILVRLSYQMSSETPVEAVKQIEEYFREPDQSARQADPESPQTEDIGIINMPSSNGDDDVSGTQPVPEQPSTDAPATSQPPSSEPAPRLGTGEAQKEEQAAEEPETDEVQQSVSVFLAPSGTTPFAALAGVDDDDFTPTVAHAQLHQARLQESSRNKRLLSDLELERAAAADQVRIDAIRSLTVKVRFPDNTSAEWQLGRHHTGGFLYSAVRAVMAPPSRAFRLVLPGSSRTLIRDDTADHNSLVGAYRLSGRVLVNLVCDDAVGTDARKLPFLRPDVARRARDVSVPAQPPLATAPCDGPAEPTSREAGSADRSGSLDKANKTKKIPKWLKLGKK